VIYDMKGVLRSFIRTQEESPIPEEARLSLTEIRRLINDKNSGALNLIQSNRDQDIRDTSADIVTRIYEERRHRGVISPQTLFVYDEADEFMPQGSSDGYAESRARRMSETRSIRVCKALPRENLPRTSTPSLISQRP
jgi:hypothetical protein